MPGDRLHIDFVSAEAQPFASTGGLAEVVGALPRALARRGHTCTVILPFYRRIVTRRMPGLVGSAALDGETIIEFAGRAQHVAFHRHAGQGVSTVFVDAPELFDREGLYGTSEGDYEDNWFRFAVFSRAALEYVRRRGERSSAIHAHDWQTGLVPAYQKVLFPGDPVIGGVPVLFTIHNLAFQGIYPASTLPLIGLPWEVLHLEGMEYWGQISYLKAGINFSERITTVSPGYAREVVVPEHGCGFDGVLWRRSGEFTGILNGIDTDRWNPASDRFLPARYTVDDMAGKAATKRILLEETGLPVSNGNLDRPLIGIVSRLTDQKGLDLFAIAAGELMGLDAAWIMLGSGERRYEEFWVELSARFPDRVSATIGYDERLEHLIEAGSDMLLMPSRFEPCGLNQLHAQRYGTLPIVRATGGLDDTVVDAATESGGTGFKFGDYTPDALVGVVRRALTAYHQKAGWQALQRNAMQRDSSWDVAAREYVKVYRALS